MDTFFRFFYEFLLQAFSGIFTIIEGLVRGVITLFDIKSYIKIVNFYKGDFSGHEWLFVGIAIVLLLIVFATIGLLIYFLVRKYIRFRKTIVEQESMLEEIALKEENVIKHIKDTL